MSIRNALVLLLTLALNACGIYEKYDYGKSANSRLDDSLVTTVEMPVSAPSISQRYRPQGPTAQSERRGFDLLVPSRAPVLAASDGLVSRSALSFLFGNQLFINHGRSASAYRVQTRYFHLVEALVGEGEKVRRGQLIDYSGMTGLAGIFPHLHFEVHQLNDDDPALAIRDLDPQRCWFDGPGKITCYHRAGDFSARNLTYPVPCRGLECQQ
ncbi:MAG: M23 family metallopeptidase [Gammaproteobacteria bacterium]|nr:M23 family metallopeptidase [Gammaproteobacteria bacterium]